MKVIDLLNKMANGEEVQQFEYYGGTYRKSKKDNKYWCNGMWFEFDIDVLNDEVELLEEPKGIPEKINNSYYHLEQGEQNQLFKNKINEIIDYLESKGE